jgi:hypothetical protein
VREEEEAVFMFLLQIPPLLDQYHILSKRHLMERHRSCSILVMTEAMVNV